jgi:hypothetical protein
MKQILVSVILGVCMSASANANAFFNGNESISQLFDKLKLNSAKINNQVIQVSTISGTYRGKLQSVGSNFLILEIDLAKTSEDLKTKTTQKVFSQQIVSIPAITAIEFEILR